MYLLAKASNAPQSDTSRKRKSAPCDLTSQERKIRQQIGKGKQFEMV
jgi:hypothetical protein